MADTFGCSLARHLVVLSEEGLKLDRLEMMLQERLRSLIHDAVLFRRVM